MGASIKMKLLRTLASTFVVSTVLMSAASAQSNNYRSNNYERNGSESDYVTLYEQCDFRGDRRDVLVGEFRNMRSAGFDNDSVSSIEVPNGMRLTVYQDDDFRGGHASFNQNISCLDRQWNNKISSFHVRVIADNVRRGYRGNENRNNNGRHYRNNAANVNAQNVAQVYFDGKVLQQIDKNNWRMNSLRGGPQVAVMQFKEVRRDRDSVYLQNDYTAEKVRIDLFANDVTMISRKGRQQRYAIQGKQASLNVGRPTAELPNRGARRNNEPSRRISQDCFDYRATSRGGEASVRFQTRESLKRFNNSTVTGRVCHKGSLTMEIGKRDANTDVNVEILGRSFRFVPQEREDELKNSWYRKRVRLSVGG